MTGSMATTRSSPLTLINRTPWVFLPILDIPLAFVLIMVPVLVIIIISSSSATCLTETTSPFLLVVLIAISNINLIKEQNYKGVIGDIQVQEGMLLGREKQALDYIYNESEGKPIVVSASTMPLRINTTWAYLFNWYGNSKYGRVPYWAGPTAQGYPGEQFKEEQKQYGEYVGEFRLGDEKSQSQIIVQKSIHSD